MQTSTPSLFVRDRSGSYRAATASELFGATRSALLAELGGRQALSDPREAQAYLTAHFAGQGAESFVILHLDTRHRVLGVEEAARGTIDGCSVYPREVLRSVLSRGSAAVIFAHNHPSGVPEPSAADRRLTDRLREALALVDVRVLDHIIIGGTEAVSLAQRGLL